MAENNRKSEQIPDARILASLDSRLRQTHEPYARRNPNRVSDDDRNYIRRKVKESLIQVGLSEKEANDYASEVLKKDDNFLRKRLQDFQEKDKAQSYVSALDDTQFKESLTGKYTDLKSAEKLVNDYLKELGMSDKLSYFEKNLKMNKADAINSAIAMGEWLNDSFSYFREISKNGNLTPEEGINQEAFDKYQKQIDTQYSRVMNILNSLPNENGTIYRGININVFAPQASNGHSIAQYRLHSAFKGNHPISLNQGMTSWTTDAKKADSFAQGKETGAGAGVGWSTDRREGIVLKTKGEKLNARNISHISPFDESEVIVRGSGEGKGRRNEYDYFRVTGEKYDKKTKTYYYELEPTTREDYMKWVHSR